MPKTDKQLKILSPVESSYTTMPWSCNHHPTFSEIEAYVPITGNFEIIADIHDSRGVDAEVVAGLIARSVNRLEKNENLIEQMSCAIELCLECRECLSWEAEHDAQAVLKKVGKTP
jgi:hypothetical protein